MSNKKMGAFTHLSAHWWGHVTSLTRPSPFPSLLSIGHGHFFFREDADVRRPHPGLMIQPHHLQFSLFTYFSLDRSLSLCSSRYREKTNGLTASRVVFFWLTWNYLLWVYLGLNRSSLFFNNLVFDLHYSDMGFLIFLATSCFSDVT